MNGASKGSSSVTPNVSPRVEEPDLSANPIFAPVRAESFDNSTGSACEGLIKRTLSQGDNEAAGLDSPCDPASDTPLPELHHLNLHAEAVPVMPLSSLGFSSGLDPNPKVSLPPEPPACDATRGIQAPEALAERLLANLPVTPENVLTLMSLVPKEVPRSNVQTQGQRFSSGAWVHGGVSGLYRHATKLPATTKVLCALVKQVLSDHPFNAVTFLDECNSTCHRDVNNLDLPSLVIPLTVFQGGALWHSAESGQHYRQTPNGRLCGHLLDIASGPKLLPDPHRWHAVEPWQGRRAVLLAFSVRDSRLTDRDTQALASLGFNLCHVPSKAQPVDLRSSVTPACPSKVPLVSGFDLCSPKVEICSPTIELPTSPEQMLFVELCCGTAVLSKAAEKVGFRVFPVDCDKRRAPYKKTVFLDIANPEQRQVIKDLLLAERHRVVACFAAPVCGTASKARERPLPSWKARGFSIPVPLRCAQYPDGKPEMSQKDRRKVQLANQLYDGLSDVMQYAHCLGILCILENPTSSWYWSTSFFRDLLVHTGDGFNTDFHSCCHGGSRPKLTRFWATQDVLSPLAATCDNTHPHKPWKPLLKGNRLHFVTKDEAQYPELLCARLLSILVQLHFPHLDCHAFQHQCSSDTPAATRLVLGKQPRGNKFNQLVSEFSSYLLSVAPVASQSVNALLAQQPKGARIVHRWLLKFSERGSVQPNPPEPEFAFTYLDGLDMSSQSDVQVEICKIGIPCSPEVFLERAVLAGHPLAMEQHLSDDVKEAAYLNFKAEPYGVAKMRVDALAFWTDRAKSLQTAEANLHSGMPAHLQPILSGKRLLLLREMMDAAGCQDPDLVSDICAGFDLTGWQPASGHFPARVRRPEMSTETLKVLSAGLNASVLGMLRTQKPDELEMAAWRETQKELEAGWIWIDSSASTEGKIVGHRFAIRQGSKDRVIDDLTVCRLNGTVGLKEKYVLHSVDKLAAFLSHTFSVHGGVQGLCGRTYDLTSAYKQFGVNSACRDFIRLALRRPDSKEPLLLGLNSMPFGAVASVSSFLRISIALWMIGLRLLKIVWTCFFDDFSVVTRKCLESSAAWAVESLFKLLGIHFAESGKKAVAFAPCFKMLGLEVDLSGGSAGKVLIGHTEERRTELCNFIDGILESGSLSQKTFERLRGRMVFFEGFAFGRVSSSSVRLLARECDRQPVQCRLSPQMRHALLWLRSRVESANPLLIGPRILSTWFIFTDGACEPEQGVGGIGAVLVSPSGVIVEYFGTRIPSEATRAYLKVTENPIYYLEVLPLLVSVATWANYLEGSQLVMYLDNEAARHSMIRCHAEAAYVDRTVQKFIRVETELQLRLWFGRVPTSSNIADPPSRMQFESLVASGAKRVFPDIASMLELPP